MAVLPSVNAPLVGMDRRPTRVLMALLPGISSDSPAVNPDGSATPIFRAQLQDAIGGIMPAEGAALIHPNGKPTRVMVGLLQRLP